MISRRRFALVLGALAAAGRVNAQTAESVPPPPSPEAEARIAAILGKYGSRFSEEQKADIRRHITGNQQGLDAMRAYPLDNAVEPATLFRVYRNDRRPRRPVSHRR